MATLAGYDAACTITTNFTNLQIDVSGFSITMNSDVNIYESFESSWKFAQSGTQQITGTMTGTATDTDAQFSVTYADYTLASTFVITTATDGVMTFANGAVLSNIVVNKPSPGAAMEMTADFTSSGAVTFT